MPGIIFDDSVINAGSDVMSGSRVYYVAWELITSGPSVRMPNLWDVNSLVGIGHYELGNDLTPGGLISGIGWDAPQWLYTQIGQNVARPGAVASDFTSIVAQYFRWCLTPGTEVRFIVFGDT